MTYITQHGPDCSFLFLLDVVVIASKEEEQDKAKQRRVYSELCIFMLFFCKIHHLFMCFFSFSFPITGDSYSEINRENKSLNTSNVFLLYIRFISVRFFVLSAIFGSSTGSLITM